MLCMLKTKKARPLAGLVVNQTQRLVQTVAQAHFQVVRMQVAENEWVNICFRNPIVQDLASTRMAKVGEAVPDIQRGPVVQFYANARMQSPCKLPLGMRCGIQDNVGLGVSVNKAGYRVSACADTCTDIGCDTMEFAEVGIGIGQEQKL